MLEASLQMYPHPKNKIRPFGDRELAAAINQSTRRRWLAGGVFMLVLGVAVCWFGVWVYSFSHPYSGVAFNRVAWDAGGSPRTRMTDDIIKHRVFRGMTREQVEALLGRATREDTQTGTLYWLYELGPIWSGLDSHWLQIKFAKDGTVVEAYAWAG